MSYLGTRALGVLFTMTSFFAMNAQPIQVGTDNQQHVNYTMQIDFHAAENKFNGYQKAVYINNSPDTLQNIFYHLFYNAFQPGSAMDQRAENMKDQEGGIVLAFRALKPDQYGYKQIDSVKINGRRQQFVISGTIMKIMLDEFISPKSETIIE